MVDQLSKSLYCQLEVPGDTAITLSVLPRERPAIKRVLSRCCQNDGAHTAIHCAAYQFVNLITSCFGRVKMSGEANVSVIIKRC